jgi:hypothetical protein
MRSAAYVKTLTAAGVDPRQAQAHAEAMEIMLSEAFLTRDHFDAAMARVDARFEGVDARFDSVNSRIDRVEARLDLKIERVDAKLDVKFAELDAKVESTKSDLQARISESTATMIKWMVAHSLALVALVYGIARFVR